MLHPSILPIPEHRGRTQQRIPFYTDTNLEGTSCFSLLPAWCTGPVPIWGLLLWAGLYPPVFLPGFIFPHFQLYDINNNLHFLEGGGWEQRLMNSSGRYLCVCACVSSQCTHAHTCITFEELVSQRRRAQLLPVGRRGEGCALSLPIAPPSFSSIK